MAATLVGAAVLHLSILSARTAQVADIRTTDADVLGCDTPGRMEARVRYSVSGRVYEERLRMLQTYLQPANGTEEACAAGSLKINYQASIPTLWSFAAFSPIRRFQNIQPLPTAFYLTGPVLLGIAGLWGIVCWIDARRQRVEDRLNTEGKLIDAELISIQFHEGDDGTSITCRYAFLDPLGRRIIGKETVSGQPGLTNKNAPPLGTPMRVVYVDETLFEAL